MHAAPIRSTYDAIVVGTGIVGLACARAIAESGRSVLALDRDRPGAGASGVAAGMLAPVTEADFGELELLALNLAAAREWPAFAATLAERTGLDIAFETSGALAVAADRDDAGELRRLHELHRRLGLESEWLPAGDCRRLEPGLSPRIAGGITAPGEARVDPVATLAALERAFADAGGHQARIEVDEVELAGGAVAGIRGTRGERVAAPSVVVAAGAWSGALSPEERLPVRPVKGQLLALRRPRGRPAVATRTIRTPRCYVLERPDGRVIVGATVEDRGFDTTVTADAVYRLLEAAAEVLPEVLELDFEGARAGLRPGTPDNRPLVGRAAVEGLVWATGHYRNGVLLAPLTARAVAAILGGEDPPEEWGAADPRRLTAGPSVAGGTR